MLCVRKPYLMSGFMEAWLDSMLISFLQDKMGQMTLDMCAHLLFVILCGNLDLEPSVRAGDQRRLDWISRPPENNIMRFPDRQRDPDNKPRNASSPWTHIENLVHPLRIYGDSARMTPRQSAMYDQTCVAPDCKNHAHTEAPIPRDRNYHRGVARTKSRLRTMIACQYSFGATVGAPIVFFLGTFIFTIAEALSHLGDKLISESLAFGMWYMITPHLSILSGLLPAGNNPNTVEGVVAHKFGESEEPGQHHTKLNRIFELNYDSRYRPQWLWFRGRSKRDWIQKLWRTYEMRPATGRRGRDVLDEDMDAMRRAMSPRLRNWIVILGMTLLLMGIPFSLGLITVFHTPPVGVACRSLTFIVHTIQYAKLPRLSCGCIWAYAECPEKGKWLVELRKDGYFDRHGFWTPTNMNPLFDLRTWWSVRSLWVIICHNLAAIFGLGGVFTALGGTVIQWIGVYKSRKCDLTVAYWTGSTPGQKVVLSNNTALQIKTAATYWKACFITATIFLGVVCFGVRVPTVSMWCTLILPLSLVVTMIHAENGAIIDWTIKKLEKKRLFAPKYHVTSHPPVAEIEATYRAISLSSFIDVPILIVHVSQPSAAAHIAQAQSRGLPIYAETCPQYLFLTRKDLDKPGFEGAKCVCSPPPREGKEDHDAIWKGLEDGTFTVLSSDHCPFLYADTEVGKMAAITEEFPQGHFRYIANGISGVETRMSLVLEEERLELKRFVEVVSTNAAKLYGLYPRKGALIPGISDADLTIWYPEGKMESFELRNEMLHHNVDYTVYEGRTMKQWPRYTVLRGEVVWDRDRGGIVGKKGYGQFLERTESSLAGSFSKEEWNVEAF